MPKPKKVYRKGDELIVCFKNAHYVAPSTSRVKGDDRVPVIPGEEPNTVVVLGETWTLKGTYSEAKSGPPRAHTGVRPAKEVVTPSSRIRPSRELQALIDSVGLEKDALVLLHVAYANWCTSGGRLPLYQGLNYLDETVTRRVRELGLKIMHVHRVGIRRATGDTTGGPQYVVNCCDRLVKSCRCAVKKSTKKG